MLRAPEAALEQRGPDVPGSIIEGAKAMQTINRLDVLRAALRPLRRKGQVALVPTMGALHNGHLALVAAARARARHVVVSIFVNPLQFSAGEDLDAYPRPLTADSALLERAGVAVLWAPSPDQMYPAGHATRITVQGVSEGLCGAARPGHFDGVATVVTKLFNQVQPDLALFGEKDWQQLAVIRRAARDLDLTHPAADAILGVPTLREADGLAMSSRNAYLTSGERAAAAALPQAMRHAIARLSAGSDVAAALDDLRATLMAQGFSSVDYVQLVDAVTLGPPGRQPARLLVAARIGRARLIDNMAAAIA